jgi:hypothetical protein
MPKDRTHKSFKEFKEQYSGCHAIQYALDNVPTVQLLKSSAATSLSWNVVLKRPSSRIVVALIACVVLCSEDGFLHMRHPQPPVARRFRFRVLRVRDGSAASSLNVSNFRILLDGDPIRAAYDLQYEVPASERNGVALVASFSNPVEWNGWSFNTALDTDAGKDPGVFYFEYERDSEWLVAGGSGPYYHAGVLFFLPTSFGTCRPRGCSNTFRNIEQGIPTYTAVTAPCTA